MKKTLLLLSIAGALSLNLGVAQTVIFDNGPYFDQPGGGAGGADASTLHDLMSTYGAGHAVSSGYRIADDIIVPAGTSWQIDSLVFYAYQTGSGNTSSINQVNVRIWDGDPSAGGSIIWGDSLTNLLMSTSWSGAYRTGDVGGACAPSTCVDRPIMRNATEIGQVLPAGTYWLDWQTGGSLASGPWAPPVNLGAGNTTTGNALQYNVTTMTWGAMGDGGTLTPQGFPFLVVGTILTGISENNDIASKITIFPNPVKERATLRLNTNIKAGDQVVFNVYDVLGNKVRSLSATGEKELTLLRKNMNNGIYLYEVILNGENVKNGKLILQ